MGDVTIDSLVDSLFDLERPVFVKDIYHHLKQLDEPLDIIAYANKVLSMKRLGYREIIKFEEGIEEYLLEEQKNQIEKARKDKEDAEKDALTGLPRRVVIEKEMRKPKSGYSTLMLDIDHFKRFNDDYEHLVGDIVLKTVAGIIARNVRKIEGFLRKYNGFVGRYGGEEFYVELNNCMKEDAEDVAERIRRDVEENVAKLVYCELGRRKLNKWLEKFKKEKVTISIGVADEKQGNEPLTVRRLADAALRYSKESGRNQVKVYDPKDKFYNRFFNLTKKS